MQALGSAVESNESYAMLFRGFFIISGIMAQIFDLRNYGNKIHQNLQNYGYQFFEQNGTSRSHDRLRHPPHPRFLVILADSIV